ncbi:MAG: hypothetical protein HEQ20_26325 [Aphanizomenon flos-aquae KM1D3_PB]|nr:MAG: hypothetical protein HEQ20_26325 [Aphanizomenon flos-aquae KM1D3_PB]
MRQLVLDRLLDSIENLQHLHRTCHKQEHSKSKSIA